MLTTQRDANMAINLFWKSEICPLPLTAHYFYEHLASVNIFYAFFHVKYISAHMIGNLFEKKIFT